MGTIIGNYTYNSLNYSIYKFSGNYKFVQQNITQNNSQLNFDINQFFQCMLLKNLSNSNDYLLEFKI